MIYWLLAPFPATRYCGCQRDHEIPHLKISVKLCRLEHLAVNTVKSRLRLPQITNKKIVY